jgi:iron complex outermembrane receptor protein
MSNRYLKGSLLATTVIAGMAFATPAMSQTTNPGAQVDPNAVPTTADEQADEAGQTQNPAPGEPVQGVQADTEGDDAIVVTGTILRATSKATPSPVQVVDFEESEKRGINTVNDAIQSISANGAGSMSNAWSAGGNFANGAAAASLRGLLTSNTLVLFDGLRGAYFPLADDGTRNFVDLNTIPDAIVDRVEVLKDGASSTYGADAIAGVINIITKRQVNGLHINASGGISRYGDAGERKLDATYGFGDLDRSGFNVYVSGGYMTQGGIEQQDRGFPYNTGNLCQTDYPGLGGGYNTGNLGFDCGFNVNVQPVFFVRPSGPNNTVGASAASQFNFLNPAAGCGGFGTYDVTAEDQALLGGAAGAYPAQLCREDLVRNYYDISLPTKRLNASVRGTLNLTDTIEAYAIGNWIQTEFWADGLPGILRSNTPPLIGPVFTMSTLALPVYICPDPVFATPTSTVGCSAASPGATLNPQNPFAAEGSQARITGFFQGVREKDYTRTRGLRGAAGVSGEFMGGIRFNVEGTAMKVNNLWQRDGRVYVANLLTAINTGQFNFTNPDQNSQETLDFVFPRINGKTKSNLWQLQGNLSKDLIDLGGGPLQVGIGATIRREEVNAPSANPERDINGNPLSTDLENLPLIAPTQRYTGRVNPFGTIGKRTVRSVYGEVLAPVIDQVDLSFSGRYDKYSTGQSAFSPKAGVKVTPIREVAFRGTWSKGFRIGSFAESFGLPTTGYTPGAGTVPNSYAALFPGGKANNYLSAYSIGLTQIGNPGLKPEKSRNLTLGVVAEPIRNVSFSVDYWDIKKNNVITGADTQPAIDAYYAGQPIPEGFEIIPEEGVINPVAGVPNRIAFIRYPYINAAQQRATGIDFAAAARVPVGGGVTLSSNLEATRLIRLNTCFEGAGCQRYAGTLGPYVITSASGSPRWRGSWQNIVEFGRAYMSLTGFYTSGYGLHADDAGEPQEGESDCDVSHGAHFNDGTTQCRTKKTLYWNLAGGYDVTDDMNVYFNVNNLLGDKPPIDTGTYGGYLYNPAWSYPMMVGRYFRVGAKIKM